jgi:hypothetical protein
LHPSAADKAKTPTSFDAIPWNGSAIPSLDASSMQNKYNPCRENLQTQTSYAYDMHVASFHGSCQVFSLTAAHTTPQQIGSK